MGFELEVVAKGIKEKEILNRVISENLTDFSELMNRANEQAPLDGIEIWPEEESSTSPEFGVTLYCKIWLDTAQKFYAKSLIKLMALSPLSKRITRDELLEVEDNTFKFLNHTTLNEFPYFVYDGMTIVIPTAETAQIKNIHMQSSTVNELGMCSLEDANNDSLFSRATINRAIYNEIEKELRRIKSLLDQEVRND